MKFLKKFKGLIPVLFTLIVIAFFYFTKITALKFYPPTVNFCIFLLFFLSIFSKETIIQKFARMTDGELSPSLVNYTRKLTYVWSIFLFINFSIALATVFLPDKFWILYNGFISYILLGMFFAIEYLIRIFFKRKNNSCDV